jgi:hypothetical protein
VHTVLYSHGESLQGPGMKGSLNTDFLRSPLQINNSVSLAWLTQKTILAIPRGWGGGGEGGAGCKGVEYE